jgi:hypothetical protein
MARTTFNKSWAIGLAQANKARRSSSEKSGSATAPDPNLESTSRLACHVTPAPIHNKPKAPAQKNKLDNARKRVKRGKESIKQLQEKLTQTQEETAQRLAELGSTCAAFHEYLSSHLTFCAADSYDPGSTGKGPKTRMLPVAALLDKSAASQFEYFNSTIDNLLETYKDTDLAWEGPLRWQEFIARAHAFLADHTADQDLFFALLPDWRNQAMDELRGIEVLESMSDVDLLQAYAKQKDLPGSTNWDKLTEPERDSVVAEAWIELCIPLRKLHTSRCQQRTGDRLTAGNTKL